MKPYYEEFGVRIFCGDSRDLVPQMEAESIITDPVWPNSVFESVVSPQLLLAESLKSAAVQRIAIHLGCDSDPRFLQAVPLKWPFLRVCWLDYARPSYKGRILYGSDIAYVFGDPPKAAKGRTVLPGKCMAQKTGFRIQKEIGGRSTTHRYQDNKRFSGRHHPCPRRIQHVQWLCNWFGGASVLDPFGGSGTTAVACKQLGIPCTMIEIEERYCEIAVKRLAQGVFDLQDEETAESA
jgi:hypothetical protein